MLAQETQTVNTPSFEERMKEDWSQGRAYWLYEAQFGEIPANIAEMYNISPIDQLNAQLANCEDYAEFLAQQI